MHRFHHTVPRAARVLVLILLTGGGLTLAAWYTGLASLVSPATRAAYASYAFDVSDRQKLVGAASNVFVGQVVALTGTEGISTSTPDDQLPQTQFEVMILENIKGTLDGTVNVSQYGGRDRGNPEYVALVEDDPLLIPGATYLFTTYHNPQTHWYQIIAPGYANIHLKDEQTRTQVVATFKAAVENQISPFATADK